MPIDPYLPYDPFALPNQQDPFKLNTQQKPQVPTLSPEEEDSLLSKITGKALGGLGYVGSVLEKSFGGRALRGLAGGKPRELLSIIPGSDTFGITNEADRVSGKELLGLKDNEGWGATLGGLALELATDPATYLTLGGSALTEAGQVAKLAGALPRTLSGRVGTTLNTLAQSAEHAAPVAEALANSGKSLAQLGEQSLGGIFGLGLPFAKPSVVVGAGEGGQRFLQGASALHEGAKSLPLLGLPYRKLGQGLDAGRRYGRALFDPSVLGATSQEGQLAAEQAHRLEQQLIRQARTQQADFATQLGAAGRTGQQAGAELRQTLEGVLPGTAHPVDAQIAQALSQGYAQDLQTLQGLGVDIQPLHDPAGIGFAPRQAAPPAGKLGGAPRQPLVAKDARIEGRADILKGLPLGTEQLNQLGLDPLVHEGSLLQAAGHIQQNYLPAATTQAQQAANYKQALHLADYARSQGQQRLFPNHPLADTLTYKERVARLRGAAEASHDLLARTAVDISQPGAVIPEGARRLQDVLEQAGLKYNVANAPGGMGAEAELARRLGVPPQSLGNYVVPGSSAKDLTRFASRFNAGEGGSQVLKGFDWLTNLTKGLQTAPFPGFHVRNLVGGWWNNLLEGGGSAKGIKDIRKLLAGEILPDANQIAGLSHLSPEQATQTLAQQLYGQSLAGAPHITRESLAGPVSGGVEDILARIPGQTPKTLGGALGSITEGQPGWWNPLDSQNFAPVNAGRNVGDVVEGTNRGSLYLDLLRQGYTPEAAGQRVMASHFDYSRQGLTDFEANVARRLIPFYRFARGNLPYQVEQLAQRPGSGLAAIQAKLAQNLRQDAGFLPNYLGSGLAIPTGPENEQGTRRYLTRLDLPTEQAFETLKGGPNAVADTLMGVLGQANPLIKAPLEYATGKQFFTGRDLEDLYSMTGNTAIDQLIANSPASRFVSTVRTLEDPRKWQDPLALPLNLATGLKLTDVDLNKQRQIAGREYIQSLLSGVPEVGQFQTLYPRAGALQNLNPDQLELLKLNRTLEQRALKEAALRKKQIRVGG